MATLGDVITITSPTVGCRKRLARKAIIIKTVDLGDDMYGVWFHTVGAPEYGGFDGVRSTTGTLVAVHPREFKVTGHVMDYAASTLRRLALRMRGTAPVKANPEAGKVLEIIETQHEWLTS